MNWAFSIRKKIKAAITILVLCMVILLSNFRSQDLMDNVSDKIETIYKDRLIVQHLIFSYNQVLETLTIFKEEGLVESKLLAENSDKINELEQKYLNTKLTSEEAELFDDFSEKVEKLKNFHLNNLAWDSIKKDAIKDLNRLETIQMEEAATEMAWIKRLSNNQQLNFKLEMVVLIVLLLIVQILILNATAATREISKSNSMLN